jgi:hypothetical protein
MLTAPREESTTKFFSGEIWLKVIMHVAGIGALFATPSVATLLAYLVNELGLMR